MVIEHDETKGKVLYRVSRESGPPSELGAFTGQTTTIQTTPGAAYLFRLTFPSGEDGRAKGERPYEIHVTFR